MKKWILPISICVWLLAACTQNHSSATMSDPHRSESSTLQDTQPPITTLTTDKEVSLMTLLKLDSFNFDSPHIEIAFYGDETFCFSTRNKELFEAFKAFLNEPVPVKPASTPSGDKHFLVTVSDGATTLSFDISDDDIIRDDITLYNTTHSIAGVWDRFTTTFTPYMEQYARYCRLKYLPGQFLYEYTIYDKDQNILVSEQIRRSPHLFYNDGIVHFWCQGGTGALSRWAVFYDVQTGQISPTYSGQTDSFGTTVCSVGSKTISLYHMFSGDLICTFDSFEKPLSDFIEPIISAYFTEDGKQIFVTYLTTDMEQVTQTFDVPIS